MEDQPSAPPVVAVVVADTPGEWFDHTLAGLAAQDYPNQSVLIMDAGGTPLPIERVAAVLPEAYVRRARPEDAFPVIANDVLASVEGAAFLLFCHDDVVLDPNSVSLLVDEALRSNAGIVAPKIVEWDRPERLLDVGLGVDKTGASAPLVDRGEIDQEQHDAVRDVFAVSTTCVLVRNDLFSTLGGFDPLMSTRAAGVDLCWRAQVAGARVLVAPQARVRHRERGRLEPRAGDPDGGESRGHLRAMLKSYSAFHLLRVLPQAAVVTIIETVLALAARRWSHARHLVAAWIWNFRTFPQLRPLRRNTGAARTVPDSEVRRMQARGSVRLTRYLHRFHAEERAQALVAASEELVESVWRGPARAAGMVFAVLALAIAVGSRDLIGGRLAAVGDFAPLPSPTTLLRHYLAGWRTTGLGSPTAAPPAFALFGLLGGLFVGQMDLLAKILVLAVWPVAGIGAWRMTKPLASSLARVVGLVAYLALPLPYNAVARGQWGGLIAYAVFPWVLARLARLSGIEPFALPGLGAQDPADPNPRRVAAEVAGLGVLLAVAGSLAPSILVAFSLCAFGLLLGSLVVGQAAGAARAMAGAGAVVGIVAVLWLPWTIELGRPGGWTTVTGVARSPELAPGLGQLLRFETGPMGSGPLGWAFLAVAALALIVGRGWRLAWAVRLWVGALTCVGVAWTGARGWSPLRFESPDVLLAGAAACLGLAAALGAVAFEIDLRGYRFGWRQAASVMAGGLLALATVPVLGAAVDGRWQQPAEEAARGLGWMGPETAKGAFRVLWLGDPTVLPLDGWALGNGLAYATSRNGAPSATDLLPGPPAGATGSISNALEVAATGGTARLGRLLAPMAIRYLVLPRQAAPGEPKARRVTPSAALVRALGSQLDLRILASDPSLAVYENEAWGPGLGQVPDPEASRSEGLGALGRVLGVGADLSSLQPVLTTPRTDDVEGPVRFAGRLDGTGLVLLAESPSARWNLEVSGAGAPRATALGVMNAFAPAGSGPAQLVFRAPVVHRLALVLNVGLWAATIWLWARFRRPEPSGP